MNSAMKTLSRLSRSDQTALPDDSGLRVQESDGDDQGACDEPQCDPAWHWLHILLAGALHGICDQEVGDAE